MKKIFTLLVAGLGSICLFAQQDIQLSQYMFSKLYMNPGYAGMKHAACFTAIGRNQWAGFYGAPKSGVFSGDCYFPQIRGGAGLNVMYDKLGFESNVRYNADYSFHIEDVAKGTLGIGLEVGGYSKRVGPTGNDQWQATTNWQNDITIPAQLKSTVMDFGFGAWYERQNLWFGISSTHLNAKLINNGLDTMGHTLKYQIARHYFITGGARFFENNTWELRPSFLVKSDETITTFDVNVIAMRNEQFWLGLSYRYKDALCPMVGFQVSDEGGLKIGFAYDYNTSGLHPYNNGTFELFVNYCVPIVWTPKRVGHGDVRIFDPPWR